ncbi:hypothetical protein GCM10027592_61440 [Spirosoma flavus]
MIILKTIKRLGLVVLLLSGAMIFQKAEAQPGVSVPVESFYDELAPYGQWMQYPGYGDVWLPNAGPDFQPYGTNGHWVVTEYGNTWVSDYNWGWAPFHYGRWIYDPAYGGWLWVPGPDWGPAWVTWRSGGGYYGWAPLAPGWGVNVNINIPAPYWTFVPQIYITSPRLYSYCVPRPQIVNVYHNTTIINNYYRTNNRAYAYGPPRDDIERVTRSSVPVYRVDHMDRPGRSVVGNGSVGFYRPGSSYNRDYGRNDRFNNANPRPTYDGNTAYSRGNVGDNNVPNRTYERSPIAPNRGNSRDGSSREYSQPFSGTPNGNVNNRTVPDVNNSAPSQPNRFEPSRGRSFAPDNNTPQIDNNSGQGQSGGWNSRGFQQGGGFQRNRTFERSESQPQPQMNSQPSQPMQGGRSETFQQRSMEGQGQGQRFQQRSMEQGGRSHEGFNPGGRRGPR